MLRSTSQRHFLKNKANLNLKNYCTITNLEMIVEMLGSAVVAVVNLRIGGFCAYFYSFDTFGLLRITVDGRQDCTDLNIAGCYLERIRHLRPERFENTLDSPTEHRIVRPGHSDIGDISGTFGKDFLIGRCNMSMCAETKADPAVEMIAHCDLLARGFGVEIDDYDVGLLSDAPEYGVDGIVRTISRFHKKTANQSDHSHYRSLAGFVKGDTFAGRVLGEVRRPDDVVGGFERLNYVPLAVGVISQRDQIHSGTQQLFVNLRRQPRSPGGVLGVGYHAVDVHLADQLFKLIADYPPAGPAYYVTNAENV